MPEKPIIKNIVCLEDGIRLTYASNDSGGINLVKINFKWFINFGLFVNTCRFQNLIIIL